MMDIIINNRITEKFLKILPRLYVLASLILFFGRTDWWPSFYEPRFYGFVFFISALAIVLPKRLLKTKNEGQKQALIFLRLVVAVILTLNLLGELYLYRLYLYGFQYDKFAHLTGSFLAVMSLTFLLEVYFGYSIKKAVITAAAAVLLGGLLWEVTEFSSDLLLKTSEFGVYGMYRMSDTIFDIIFDILGITISSTFLASAGFRKWLGKISSLNRYNSYSGKTENI